MKILIDVIHPAHVHFFKNAIKIWKEKGYGVIITAREKEMATHLLEKYELEYQLLSTMKKGILGLGRELLQHEWAVYRILKKEKPDVCTALGGPFIVHACKLSGIPSIVFYDTEFARLQNSITYPFADVICTPACYRDDLRKKQIRYNGYHELAYLHPNRFTPDAKVLDSIGLKEGDTFFIIRFVGWGAAHDIGESGLTLSTKIRIVRELERYGKVFISSEGELPADLKKYRSIIAPEKIHHVMAFATMLVGESATMASESAMLGVPSLFISTTGRGYTDEQEKKYGLVFNFRDTQQNEAFEKMVELLHTHNLKQVWMEKRDKMLQEKIDVTDFIVKFVETFPDDPIGARALV